MHLLNVKTRKLESFVDKVPPYAILSHRWTDKEHSFVDVTEGGLFSLRKRWSAKLKGFRAQAKKDNLAYIWIDTCCIDKRSSAELGEAINSMYKWYKNADRCYAYLSDVRLPINREGQAIADFHAQFGRSAWFSRGWTLQELIAPSTLVFFDADWHFIGLRTDLTRSIQVATGIPRNVLLGRAQPSQTSVAQRMSWAARRVTKREEDMAYCLLGLFDVNMPMIYGEGSEKAFFRLQTQIMLQTPDHSILAWGLQPNAASSPRGGLLATSPSWFAGSEHVVTAGRPGPNSYLEMIGDTTLNMTAPVVTAADATRYGLLNCQFEEDQGPLVAIPLEPTEADDIVIRSPGARVMTIDPRGDFDRTPRPVRVRIDYGTPKISSLDLGRCVDLDDFPPKLELIEVYPKDRWARCRRMIAPTGGTELVLLRVRPAWSSRADFVVVLRFQTRAGHGECEAHIVTLSKPGVSSTDESLEDLALAIYLFQVGLPREPTAMIDGGGVRVSLRKGNMGAPGNPGFRLELEHRAEQLETVDDSAKIIGTV